MSITPPDPGRALDLAKTTTYDAKIGAFVRDRDVDGVTEARWLYPAGGRTWVATCRPERRVSPETYAILREGVPSRLRLGLILIQNGSGDHHYALVDDGFEAVAVAV